MTLLVLAAAVAFGGSAASAQSDKPLGASSALNDPAWKWQIGVAGAIGHPDYTRFKTGTITAYGTYNFLPNLGLDSRATYLFETHGVKEFTFASGPRFTLPLKRLDPYISGMLGYGHFTYNANGALVYGNDSFIITYASGLDLRATKHINIRLVDLEYQRWVNFLPNGLTPTIYSAGIAYHR